MSNDPEKNLQDQLRASEDSLDASTLARLHAARNRALDKARGRPDSRWSGSWLAATAATSAIAIALFVAVRPPSGTRELPATEIESALLAAVSGEVIGTISDEPVTNGADAAETLDLLENLDFYEWLSQQTTGEQAT